MDIRKQVYITGQSYIGKISPTPSDQESILFTKYTEPEIEAGGDFDDGTTSFTLTAVQKKVCSDTPISSTFNTVSLGIDYTEAGLRAGLFVDTIVDRIEAEMDYLRNVDTTTNTELDRVVVI